MCCMDKFGFPRTAAKQCRLIDGFQTGDLVKAVVLARYKGCGTHSGRMAVRASRSFSLTTYSGKAIGSLPARYCQLQQRADGYTYLKGEMAPSSRD